MKGFKIMKKIEIKDYNWLKDNIHLYFSYNRLQDSEKDKICKLIQKIKKSA